jgi:multidrug efflux pump subunit AcrB
MSAEPGFRNRPDSVGELYVRSDKGQMIPIKTLAHVTYTSGPDSLDRFNNLPAVKILGGGKPGISSGQAITMVEEIANKTLPSDFTYDWGGASFQEKKSSGTSTLALGLAAIMVFLILAAQYERWSLPLSVMLVLPFGTFGALAAVHLRGLTNDVYFQIGLVTLLGLAAKNGILIVEYALLKNEEGLSPSAAAVEAARLRFRPILMTSLAFILGVTPLAFSSGAGAGARTAVGTGVMGGMLAATFLAIFFVPMFFKLITDRHLTETRSTAQIRAEIDQHKAELGRAEQKADSAAPRTGEPS